MELKDIEDFKKKQNADLFFNPDIKKLNWFNIVGKSKLIFKPKNLIDFPINIHNETLKASTLKTPSARVKMSPPSGSQVKKAATLPQRSIFSLNE